MFEPPHPLTSTFTLGIACGICFALIVIVARRRWHLRYAEPRRRVVVELTDGLPSDVDTELRARSTAFAQATGRPAAAPFFYSAMRDRVSVRLREPPRAEGNR
jgi:hypothetical protein